MTELLLIDRKGRIRVPKSIRDVVGVTEGMYVLLTADVDTRQITIVPFADPSAKLVQIKVAIGDVPGSLAKIAKVFADSKVDLLATESRTIQRGKSAEWVVIADVSKCTYPLSKIKEKMLREGAAKGLVIREFR